MRINQIDLDTYISNYSEISTRLSDYYAQKYDNLLVFGAKKGKTAVGLMMVINTLKYDIVILEGADEKIKKELVLYLKNLAKKDKKIIEWRIIANENCHDDLIADDLGFKKQKEVNIFRHSSNDKNKLFDLTNRYESINENFIKTGYSVKSFASLSESELRYIAENPDHVFPGFLKPEKFINNEAFNLSKDKSFALIKGEEIIGYVLISEPSRNKYIYEATCIVEKYKKTGVFLLPTIAALKSIGNSDYTSLTFAVYESNKEMLPLVLKYAMPIISNISKQINYILIS